MFQNYTQNFPISTLLIVINLLMFALIRWQIIPPEYAVCVPGILNPGTFLCHFSHIQLSHLAMNMFVLFQISPFLEVKIPRFTYGLVIISIWLGCVGILFLFQKHPSLGFSGIMLGLLTFTIGLYYRNKQFSQQLLFWLGLNIAIGLLPQISFIGHLAGAIAGAAVFGIYAVFRRHHT